MTQKLISKLLVIALAVSFIAQSCNRQGPRPEEIELTWWKPFDDARIVEPLISEFQKERGFDRRRQGLCGPIGRGCVGLVLQQGYFILCRNSTSARDLARAH